MIQRHTRIKLRRKIRTRKKRVTDAAASANKQLDRHLFRRWQNITQSRRFIASWVGLALLLSVAVVFQARSLSSHYLVATPVSGGVYTEGIVGDFTNANPLFVANNVDAAVSRLVFAPLLTYDKENRLRGDLAEKWDVDARNTVYTVLLRDKLTWHDGQPLTADDVVFTYQLIQNPDVKSPLLTGWTGIKIEKIDARTVRFTLPTPFSPFPHALTTGIVPKHLLQDVPFTQLRSDAFNTKNPVGSGPFVWKSVTALSTDPADMRQSVDLIKNEAYHLGSPGIDGVSIQTFADQAQLKDAFDRRDVLAASGLDNIEARDGVEEVSFSLTSSMMLFLRTDSPMLTDIRVRQALVRATNASAVAATLGYPVTPVREPLLKSHIGYNPAYRQFGYDATHANAQLTEAGWAVTPGSLARTKDGKPFTLKLIAESTPENSTLTAEVQKQWAAVGVKLEVELKDSKDFLQSHVLAHNYDVLMYPINLGADPDVYAYWHSSQAEVGKLNFSNFKNRTSDIALEGGRTRTEPDLRAAKYKPFLEAWRNESPAVGLYQPRYLYVTNQTVYGVDANLINTPADRYNDIHTWKINTVKQPYPAP